MNTTEKEPQELPQDVELLLPWHAAGTLSRRDAARVEEALAKDKDLARRYEMVREELGEAIRLNESLGAPSVRALEKLFAKINAEPARKPEASSSLTARLTDFVSSFSPRTLAYGAVAAALAIVLQAGILTGVFISERAAGPQLASYEQRDSIGEGTFVLVRFKPEVNAAAITRFLEVNKATIVGGPAAGTGLFRLRVGEKPLPPDELAALVKKIAAHPVVGLALPAAQP
jgi:anti-sigma-K factor RskA